MEITATIIAAGIAAKEFIQKVISPPLEETGLLFADEIKLWRFKNQIKIVTKAEEYLKSNNIKTKKVNLKVMAPLLEGAAMEEEEQLQDKWAALLANTVSYESKVPNSTIFSYILTQLSKEDAEVFDYIYIHTTRLNDDKLSRVRDSTATHIQNFSKHKSPTDSLITVDNLIRLRLIKDAKPNSIDVEFVTITDLGFNFMKACKFK